jgi:hypothetical protein
LVLDWGWGDPTPPVFCGKSVQSIENKERALEKERQESSRVRNRKEGKEIEEAEKVEEFGKRGAVEADDGETKVRRVFTNYHTTDYRNCQDISGF